MLNILQEVGKVLQPLDLSACLTGLPEDVKQDKEKITRFLLLVALLDQQAESKSARNTAVNLYQTYGSCLFPNPQAYFSQMQDLVSFTRSFYQPKTRVLRMKSEGMKTWKKNLLLN
jgi:hypothetical protein